MKAEMSDRYLVPRMTTGDPVLLKNMCFWSDEMVFDGGIEGNPYGTRGARTTFQESADRSFLQGEGGRKIEMLEIWDRACLWKLTFGETTQYDAWTKGQKCNTDQIEGIYILYARFGVPKTLIWRVEQRK